eukprot:1610559-Pleurochrysis_carterae.AAC.1
MDNMEFQVQCTLRFVNGDGPGQLERNLRHKHAQAPLFNRRVGQQRSKRPKDNRSTDVPARASARPRQERQWKERNESLVETQA